MVKKGFKHTEETKRKISKKNSVIIKKLWENKEYRKKQKIAHIGKKHSEVTRKKISKANKGLKRTIEQKKIQRQIHLGMKHTQKTKNKISKTVKIRRKERKKRLGYINSSETIEKIRNSVIKNYKKYPEIIEKIKKARAKQIFPLKDSSIEIKTQNFLKQLNIEFYTHQYMHQIKHSYQCDIIIPSKNLIIEVDGNYWHNYPIGREIDRIRTQELLEEGFNVIRLWESEINEMSLVDFKNKLNQIIK